jgi:L-asparaginase II
MSVLGELTGLDVGALKWDRDGCGMPALCMPLDELARAYAWFANTAALEQKRGDAMQYMLESVRAYPRMIAGTNRCCSEVVQDTRGKVIAKTGAEGVYAGVVPHRNFAFALKIDDGATRASEVALGALLNRLNVLDAHERGKLAIRFQPQVTNSQGKVTGVIRPSDNW